MNPTVTPQGPAPAQAGGVASPTGTPPAIAPSGAPLSSVPQVSVAPANPVMGIQQPNVAAPDLGAISQFYGIPNQTALAVNTAKTQGNVSQQGYEASVAQKQLQLSRLKDKVDPSKYHIMQTANGVRIIDSLGNEVSIGDYASITGANPADVLKNSVNPKDQQFVSDYNNFQSFLNASMNRGSSKEAAQVYDGFIKANPNLANMTPQQASQQFLSQYGSYFGIPQSGQTPQSPKFTPQYQPPIEQYYAEKGLIATNPPGYGTSGAFGGVNTSAFAPKKK